MMPVFHDMLDIPKVSTKSPTERLAEIWATEMVKVMGFPSIPGETGPPGEQLVRGTVRLARAFFAELAEPTPWPEAKKLPAEEED